MSAEVTTPTSSSRLTIVQYHYAPSLYYSESFGAARMDESQVVCIKCLEPYDPSHNGTYWKESVNNDGFNGAIHASIVPWQMIGKQTRNVNNSADITVEMLEPLLLK